MADEVNQHIECIGCRALLEENHRLRAALEEIMYQSGIALIQSDNFIGLKGINKISKAALDGEDSK